jgi:hypothetical protein
MLAAHRRAHRWIWLLLAPALVALLVAALAARPEWPRRLLDPAAAERAGADDLAP